MESIVTSLGVGYAYRVRWPHRLFALFAFAVGIGTIVGPFERVRDRGTQSASWIFIAIALWVLISGVATLAAFYNRVTLYAKAVEYRSSWSTSWLEFTEIHGRREYLVLQPRIGRVPRLRIIPNDKTLPMLEFEKRYNFDDAFYKWFSSLPDLDQVPW